MNAPDQNKKEQIAMRASKSLQEGQNPHWPISSEPRRLIVKHLVNFTLLGMPPNLATCSIQHSKLQLSI